MIRKVLLLSFLLLGVCSSKADELNDSLMVNKSNTGVRYWHPKPEKCKWVKQLGGKYYPMEDAFLMAKPCTECSDDFYIYVYNLLLGQHERTQKEEGAPTGATSGETPNQRTKK